MQSICSGQISYYCTGSRLIFTREWDGYFLFFIFRMEMIKPAIAIMIINSSYVLIITTPFVRPPKQVGAAPPAAWVSILFYLFYCRSSLSIEENFKMILIYNGKKRPKV